MNSQRIIGSKQILLALYIQEEPENSHARDEQESHSFLNILLILGKFFQQLGMCFTQLICGENREHLPRSRQSDTVDRRGVFRERRVRTGAAVAITVHNGWYRLFSLSFFFSLGVQRYKGKTTFSSFCRCNFTLQQHATKTQQKYLKKNEINRLFN